MKRRRTKMRKMSEIQRVGGGGGGKRYIQEEVDCV